MYVAAARACQPHIVVAPADVVEPSSGQKRHAKAVERTLAFLTETLALLGAPEARTPPMAVFGCIVGGHAAPERLRSASCTAQLPVQGFVLEGFGTDPAAAWPAGLLAACIAALPPDRPRLMPAAGAPRRVLDAVARGVDLFDGAFPALCAMRGHAIVCRFRATAPMSTLRPVTMDLNDAAHRLAQEPLSRECACYACQHHMRAYIHHLLCGHELLGRTLLSMYAWPRGSGIDDAREPAGRVLKRRASARDAAAAQTQRVRVATVLRGHPCVHRGRVVC